MVTCTPIKKENIPSCPLPVIPAPRGTAILIWPCLLNVSQVAAEEETAWRSLSIFFPQLRSCKPSLAARWGLASPAAPLDLYRVRLGEEEWAGLLGEEACRQKGLAKEETRPQTCAPPVPPGCSAGLTLP